MASGHSEYQRGEMEVTAHKHTFGGFMNWTVYGGSLITLILLYPILVFGANLTWPVALVITAVIGVVLGLALRLKGGWYAGVIGGAILVSIITLVISLIASLV